MGREDRDEARLKPTHSEFDGAARGRPALDEDRALRLLFEGTAKVTGRAFFQSLVRSLAEALGTHGAWVTEYDPSTRTLEALAFWMEGRFIPWQIKIDGTPCEKVIEGARLLFYPDRVLDLYPDDPNLGSVGAVSYMGVPLKDVDETILGHMAVIDKRPLPEEPRLLTVFQLFADRASAELRRMHAEEAVREREEKLARLVDGAMDAIVEFDEGLKVTHVNAAANAIFKTSAERMIGSDFGRWLAKHRVQTQEITARVASAASLYASSARESSQFHIRNLSKGAGTLVQTGDFLLGTRVGIGEDRRSPRLLSIELGQKHALQLQITHHVPFGQRVVGGGRSDAMHHAFAGL